MTADAAVAPGSRPRMRAAVLGSPIEAEAIEEPATREEVVEVVWHEDEEEYDPSIDR